MDDAESTNEAGVLVAGKSVSLGGGCFSPATAQIFVSLSDRVERWHKHFYHFLHFHRCILHSLKWGQQHTLKGGTTNRSKTTPQGVQ